MLPLRIIHNVWEGKIILEASYSNDTGLQGTQMTLSKQ